MAVLKKRKQITEKFFDSESDAENSITSNEWDYDDWDWEGNYAREIRYYNPQENGSAFGYHIEKVAVQEKKLLFISKKEYCDHSIKTLRRF